MTKYIFVLSIVLLASIVINVAFVFDIIAEKSEFARIDTNISEKTKIQGNENQVFKAAKDKIETKSDLIGSFIVDLNILKNLATREGAQKTAKAADTYIMIKKSQFEALDANTPNTL